jgi:hypothetical protein
LSGDITKKKKKKMTSVINNGSKPPKIKYKKQLRTDMMKTFGRLFSSTSESDSVDDILKIENTFVPGEEKVYNLETHMNKLSKMLINGNDGYDIEFEALLKFERIQLRQANTFKTGQISKNIKKNRYPKILPSKINYL